MSLPDLYGRCCGFPAILHPVKNVLVHHAWTHTSTGTQSRNFLCAASDATGHSMLRHCLSPPVEDANKAPFKPWWLLQVLLPTVSISWKLQRNDSNFIIISQHWDLYKVFDSLLKYINCNLDVVNLGTSNISNVTDVVVLAYFQASWQSCLWPFLYRANSAFRDFGLQILLPFVTLTCKFCQKCVKNILIHNHFK